MEPFLFAHDGKEIKRIDLFSNTFSLSIGRKTCIGYFHEGKHVSCPNRREISGEWHCNECKLNDDFFLCMKCTGEECINDKQRSSCEANMYFVYLAAFNSLLKVGISYHFRLLERLIEQGADFAAKIACVKDGKEVRLVEQEIKNYLNIQDKVAGDEKYRMLFGNPNLAVANIVQALSNLRNNGVSKYMVPTEVYDLRSYYHLNNVPYMPEKLHIKDNTRLSGTCVAAKGNILVFRNENRFFSVNAHEMIGRELLFATKSITGNA